MRTGIFGNGRLGFRTKPFVEISESGNYPECLRILERPLWGNICVTDGEWGHSHTWKSAQGGGKGQPWSQGGSQGGRAPGEWSQGTGIRNLPRGLGYWVGGGAEAGTALRGSAE